MIQINQKPFCTTIALATAWWLLASFVWAQDITTGLVGNWTLDESGGTVAYDSSGNGNDGTLAGGQSFVTDSIVPAQVGNGLDFDGADDYVAISNDTSLQLTTALTVAGWVWANSWGAGTDVDIILRKGEGNPNNWQLSVADGRATLYLDDSDGNGIRGNTVLSTGQWHHVAATWDGSEVRIYVDGILDNTPVARSAPIGVDSRPVYLGGRAGTDLLDGGLDDVRVYNRALTAADILEVYNLSNLLVGYWKFDEGSGTTAADSTTSANDAMLQNGAAWTTDCVGRNVVEFDGVNDDAITASPFQPPSTGTVAFWMRSAGMPAARSRIFGLGGNWETRQEPDGTLSFDLGAEGPPEFVTIASLGQADRWYHIVAVFDASDDSYQVYVDGQLDKSGINGDNMVAQSAGQLSFGTRTGSSENWEGAMRDFRVYGTKLSPAEVADLYGIVAHWKLDETSGTVAVDSSGRGNDATYVGSPTLGVGGAFPPKTDTAVLLDGASEYVNSNQSLLNDVDEFTLTGWFRPTSLSPVKSYFGQYGLIEVGIDVTTNQIELWTSQGGAINAANLLSPEKWKHIAAVGTGTSLFLYVDGIEVATGGSVAATYGNNAEVFKIGEGVMDVSGGYFDGRIDDVRVYSRALCPEEVNAVYKGGRPAGIRILQWLETR